MPSRASGRLRLAGRAIVAAVSELLVMLHALVWNPIALGVGLVGGAVSLWLWWVLPRVQSTADALLATLMHLIQIRGGVSWSTA